jgi:hypothetical protein
MQVQSWVYACRSRYALENQAVPTRGTTTIRKYRAHVICVFASEVDF